MSINADSSATSDDSADSEEANQIPILKDVVLLPSTSTREPSLGSFNDWYFDDPFPPALRPISPHFSLPVFQFAIPGEHGLAVQNTQLSCTSSWASTLMCLRPPPMPVRAPTEAFFLQYHRETITANHYFCYYDYKQRFTHMLFSMAEQCDALRFAMIAFSAVIYSIANLDVSARERAFVYYAKSLQGLQGLLEQFPTGYEEHQAAIATVLQLGTFDVPSCPVLLTSAPLLRFHEMLSTPYRCRHPDENTLRSSSMLVYYRWSDPSGLVLYC